ncbi:MAG: two-component regulator propeller domain-containing protein [Balneola sp.]
MTKKKILLITTFLLAGYMSGFGQKYNIKTYSVNDGLPSSFVYDVLIDEKGFVWYATENGLIKFDGKKFENYDSKHGLKDALIYDIHKDIGGDFWISTEFGGVAKFQNDTAVYISELQLLDSTLINFIGDGPDGTIWFGTDDRGIFEWNKERGLTQKISEETGLPDNQVWDFVFDEQGRAWISTSSGVAVYEQDGGITQVFTSENGLAGEYTYQVYLASDGKKWVPTSNGISVIMQDNSIENITEINGKELNYVFNVAEDDEGVIWIGTESNGLYWFDGESYTHVTKRNGLSSNYIFRLIKDEDGTIWVATDGNGVNIFKDRDFKIHDGTSGLDANSIYSALKASDGTLWFGTEDGLSSFKNGKFKKHTLPESFFDEDEIWDIEEMANGNLIMLTYDYDIIEFDGTSFYRPEFFDSLYPYYVSDIFADDDGSVWFAAFQALLRYKDGKLEKFDPPEDEYWQTTLSSITKDSRGYLWIGTEGGIAQFDGKEFRYFSEEQGLKGNNIYDVEEDDQGHLWVGTNEAINVLYDFDDEGFPREVIEFKTEDFHLQETIFLQFDQYGNLWQGTNGGLNYFDIGLWRGHRIIQQQHFAFSDFGYGVEFNGWASLLDDEGTLWFGSNSRGLISYSFPKKKTKIEPSAPPKIFLREILANNDPVFNALQDILDEAPLKIGYEQNNINFRFNAIDYKDPNRIAYQYKLDGFDEDWQKEDNIEEVRYTNLPPGKYNFLIRTKSAKSNWSQTVSLASLEIDIPFWKTIQFIIAMAILCIILAVTLVKIYIEQKEKKNLKILVDEQTKDLKSALDEKEVLIKEIHHRVKNNLAVVSGLLELQSWNIPDGEAKNAIQESKMRVLAMSKIHENLYQNDDLARVNFRKFLEDLINNVSSTMKKPEHKIELNLEIEDIPMDVNTGIPVGLITNEILSNCFKHAFETTKAGTIWVKFSMNANSYILDIKDNGVGSEENILEKKTTSLGITLIKSLSGQINGNLTYSGEAGSHFNIQFPKQEPSS